MLTRRALLGALAGVAGAQPVKQPNVVLILTDNHGAWTLGCYGNPDVRTPHIDRLAREGVLFTRAHSNNPVCSPTRASLLTGLMPSQHGVHRFLGANGAQIGPGAYYTLEELETLPRSLVRAGYTAGLCGKWHLGNNIEPQDGFSYWVTMPHGASPGFYNQQVIENGQIRTEPQYLTDFWTDHAVNFIEQNAEKPFFLMLSYNGPYGLGASMKEEIRNRHLNYYRDHPLPSMPRDAPHPLNFNYGAWTRDIEVRRKYAAEVSGIDDGVGRVLETLESRGLRDDTIVVFIGDQGLAGGHSGFWGMGDHTRPLTAYDWTTWIPFIVSHRGRLPAARRDELVSNYDVMPTLLRYLNLGAVPDSPGRDLTPFLRGESPPWDNAVFFEFENVRSIRTAEWKYIERIHEGPNELYHLVSDEGERLNLSGRREHAKTESYLRQRLQRFFARYADPKWDLWRHGSSKSGLMTGKLFGLDIQEGR